MRWTFAGLFLLLFSVTTSTALAQTATGEVESIGFNGTFRPDCWVPMVVRIKPDTADAGNYQVRVYQHDLDGDRAVYVRPITVNGSATAAEQRFWMYFLPEPIHKGLPDQTQGTLKDLQKDLTVFLCDAKGKQLVPLPVTSQLNNVDPYRESYSGRPRGSKLVLAVSANGGQQPPMETLVSNGSKDGIVGVVQDVEVANLREKDLPENPLGYEPVDTVLWLGGDPADLDAGGAHGLAALQDFVRFGGQLVVTQPTQNWQSTADFGDLMPVDVLGVGTKSTFEPLKGMARAVDVTDVGDATNDWVRARPPYQMARATARPGAVVEDWIDWKEDGSNADATPYLVRRAVGLGQVTWVAQPLTTDVQPGNTLGWPYVWLHVLGWRNDAYVPPPPPSSGTYDDPAIRARLDRYRAGNPIDLSVPLEKDVLNLGSKGAWLIVLAIGFFVVYWLVAGPGTYGYLVTKKKQSLSWFFFAVAALVATAVTVGVVKLVLRGPPEVRHLTMIRVAPGQPAIAYSRFGLYIPRDGDQTIVLQNTMSGQLSYLSALAEHPQQLGDATEFPSPLDYDVPVRDMANTEPPSLTVPYRSSLKKFQARWVGELAAKIGAGSGLTLDPEIGALPLRGALTNDTGQDLTDVYLAWHVAGDRDWVVYVPNWPKGTPLDMQRDLNPAGHHPYRVGHNSSPLAEPGEGHVISDEIATQGIRSDKSAPGWAAFWFAHVRGSGGNLDDVEHDVGLGIAYPMLSLFDRLPPMPNLPNTSKGEGAYDSDRMELFARGGRQLDAGPSLSAGQLLVLATVHGPLPIPVQVDGDAMAGDGTTLYQFLLPIDRGVDRPTTRPTAER